MRALAIERAFRCVIFLAVAAGVFKVNGSRERLRHAFDQDLPLLKPLANQIGWNPDNSKIIHSYRARILTVVIDVDLDRRGPCGLRG